MFTFVNIFFIIYTSTCYFLGGISMEEYRILFSNRLKELRKNLEKTQKEFAEYVGSTPASISAYENGLKNPSLDIIIKIAQKCNISLDWLCGLKIESPTEYKINKYSDIVKFFIALENINLKYCLANSNNPTTLSTTDFDSIVFKDKIVCSFFEELHKMAYLYNNKMIDNELFSLWVEKSIQKYDIVIESNPA